MHACMICDGRLHLTAPTFLLHLVRGSPAGYIHVYTSFMDTHHVAVLFHFMRPSPCA